LFTVKKGEPKLRLNKTYGPVSSPFTLLTVKKERRRVYEPHYSPTPIGLMAFTPSRINRYSLVELGLAFFDYFFLNVMKPFTDLILVIVLSY